MVATQLAEWSHLIPLICGSNPVIGKSLYLTLLLRLAHLKTFQKNPWNGPLKNFKNPEISHKFCDVCPRCLKLSTVIVFSRAGQNLRLPMVVFVFVMMGVLKAVSIRKSHKTCKNLGETIWSVGS